MKKLLFFLLAIIFAIQVFAQNVQIGSGTSTQYYIPLRAYYGYSYSQQIIKSSEISASGVVTTGGTISKIRYYWDGSEDFDNSTQWKVYLGHTTKTLFASTTDWAPVSGLSLVFDTLITPPTAAGWFTITLQTPFVYNGTDNLILAVDENTPLYSSGDASFFSYTSTDCGLYYHNDYTNPDPLSPPSGTKTSSVPQVKLIFPEACTSIDNLVFTSLNSSDVTIKWDSGAVETQWNIRYKLISDANWTTINAAAAKQYQITNLTPNSSYEVQVQSDCGAGSVSAWSQSLNFTTPAIATQLPFISNFENATDNSNWQFINGTQVNKWFVGNAIDPITGLAVDTLGTSGSLYISSNVNGDTNIYLGSSSANVSKVYAFRDFFIPSGATEVNLEFDWRANGNAATTDFLRVYLVPTTAAITAGANPPSGLDASAQIGNYIGGVGEHWLSKKTNWQHSKFRITSTQFPLLANNTWRLLVHWRNENTSGTAQPPAAVDNMSMNVISCSAPTSLVASNPTLNSVDLSWTETGAATTWNIYYKAVSSSTWTMVQATSNPFTLTNLNTSTPYQVKVQSDCGSDTSYSSLVINFNTTCGTITSFPWNEGFEVDWSPAGTMGNANAPYCWTNVNKGSGTSNYWQRNTYTVYSGSGSAAMYTDNSSQNNDWLITPLIALTGNQRLRFWAMNNSSTTNEVDEISIWVSNSSTLDTTGMGTYDSIPGFVKVFQTGIPVGPWAQYEVNLSQFTGNSYIAFVRKYTPNNGWNLRLDDVEVGDIPTCTRPDSMIVSNITTNSADISWVDNNSLNTVWNLYYKKSTDAAFTMVQVSSSPYTLTPIDPSSTYQVYMKTLCGAVESEATITKSFSTPCVSIDALTALPWTEGFEGITATNELPNLCWSATNLASNTYTQISDYGSYNRNAHSGSKSAYFDWGCNDYFYTPGFDLQAGTTYTFSYWYITDGLAGWTTLKAGAYSAQNTTSFIQNVGNPVSNAVNTTYQQYVGTFTPSTNGVYYFGVNCQSTYNPYYLTIDDFRLEILNCSMPTNFAASNVTPTSFDVTWDAGTATTWQVEYKVDTANVWIQQVISVDSMNISGLNPSANYQVRVAALCNGSVDTSLFANINIQTPCLPVSTLPYTENFDSYGTATNSFPPCWSRPINNGGYPSLYSYTNFSAPASIMFQSQITQPTFAVSPLLAANINALRVRFMLKAESLTYSGTITVGVMSNNTDTSTFEAIQTIVPTNTNFNAYEVSFVSATLSGANKCIAFRHNSNDDYWYYWLDDVIIDSIPSCPKPVALSISNITTNSADISWTSGGNNTTNWWLYWKDASATNYDSVYVSNLLTHTINNLNTNTVYNYYMRTNCSVEISEPTSVYTFRTACGLITSVPWTDYFDNYGTGSSIFPPCWTRNTTQTDRPYINSTNFTAPGSMYFYAGTSGTYNIAATPQFSVSIPINTLQASFMLRKTYATDSITIGVMTDPTQASTFVPVSTLAPTTTSAWEAFDVNFNSYTGTGTYIAFKIQYNSTYCYMYMDNLDIHTIPTCTRPNAPTASNQTSTSIDVSWTDPNVNNTLYKVYYRMLGDTTWSVVNNATSPTTLIGLNNSTIYQIAVATDCITEQSLLTAIVSAQTACGAMTIPTTIEPFVTVLPNNCWARYSGQLPSSGNATLTVSSGGWYANSNVTTHNAKVNLYSTSQFYWLVTPSVDLGAGSVANNVEFDLFMTAYNTINLPVVSADYADKKFYVLISTDDGLTWSASKALKKWDNVGSVDTLNNITNVPLHVSIPIVDTANNPYSGVVKFAFYAESNVYSNVFDNDLHIDNFQVTGQVCAAPTALTASGITQTNATVSWTAGANETSWEVKLGSAGATTMVTSPTYTFTSLTAAFPYTAYVRANCGTSNSAWVPVTFTTNSVPLTAVVTTAPVTTFTYNTASFVGSYTTGADTINAVGFEYKTTAATAWTNQSVSPVASPFSYNTTGLTPSTQYKVRAYVTKQGGVNVYGDTMTFTTAIFNLPVVVTDSIEVLSNSSAKFYGSITTGTEQIVARGFEYKLAAQAWTSALEVTATGTNSITATATGLDTTTTYNVRAYAETASGKVYGDEKNFVTSSGLNDVEINSISVSLYPNPASTTSTLVVKGLVGNAKVIITDIQGRTINTFDVKSVNGEAIKSINVNNYAKGVYYVRILNSKIVNTQKLIVE